MNVVTRRLEPRAGALAIEDPTVVDGLPAGL
jgi:hypothetical protein